MTVGGTLARYISWRFVLSIFSVFALCLVLIFFIDFVELLRAAGKFGSVPAHMLVLLSLMRLPTVSEFVLPFAALIGSIGGFLMLSRSSELIIARAAGMSVWQLILPGLLVAFFIGLFSVLVYNPLAATAKGYSDSMYADLFGREKSIFKTKEAGAWLRQEGADGPSIIHARIASNYGLDLAGVTALHYDEDGNLFERIEAKTAELKDGRWEFHDAWISAVGRKATYYNEYVLSTHLTPAQVKTALGSTSSVSFWELPKFIDIADKAGLPAEHYKFHYQMLLARPFLLAVMVLLAATCSLRSFRFGKIQTMVITGLGTGFAFMFLSEVSRKIGLSGLAAPEVAAWGPVGIAGCLALTVLLFQEDG